MNAAVIDTNVIVAGFLSPHGPPGRIVEWLRSGTLTAVLDDRILSEYREVLFRARFNLPVAEVELVLRAVGSHAWAVEIPPDGMIAGLPDADDAPFLECAGVAGVCLVTGNIRHFPKRCRGKISVLTPAEFVEQIQ